MPANQAVLDQARRLLADKVMGENQVLVRNLMGAITFAGRLPADDPRHPEVRDLIATAWDKLAAELSFIP